MLPRLAAVFLALALVGAGLSQRAQAVQTVWLTDSEITEHFADTTIDGRYASGRAFTERYDRDGRLTYIERGVTMTGHWSATEGTLCTIYQSDASGGCYRVARVDTNCFEFYFVSRTEEAAPGPPGGKPRWTARGAIQGRPSACRDEPSV
ncbi:hypothetical protein [Hyphomicrobium methylovorum]|uniref:hypothetical protein n=1 Tax=Hyphomicrobium methylovorum TaxID=84 RepID=UPI001FE87E0F|nr:hypothetical protein [Hyphomicrobium methylovorum]